MTVRLDTLRTISELAAIGGYDRRWLKSALISADRELRGTLLVKTYGDRANGRRCTYRCSIASLRKAWPDFGKKFATAEELDEVREQVSEVRRNTVLLARDVGQIRGQLRTKIGRAHV